MDERADIRVSRPDGNRRVSHWWDDPGTLGTIVIAGSTLCTGGVWFGRKVVKVVGRLARFLDDWDGTEARPGVTAVLGVMTRLKNLDETAAELIKDQADVKESLRVSDIRKDAAIAGVNQRLDKIEPMVTAIHHETQPNEGNSMKDQMNRVDKALKAD